MYLICAKFVYLMNYLLIISSVQFDGLSSTYWYSTQQALYVGTTLKFSLEQRHDQISTKFQCCSNVRCPLGTYYKSEKS